MTKIMQLHLAYGKCQPVLLETGVRWTDNAALYYCSCGRFFVTGRQQPTDAVVRRPVSTSTQGIKGREITAAFKLTGDPNTNKALAAVPGADAARSQRRGTWRVPPVCGKLL